MVQSFIIFISVTIGTRYFPNEGFCETIIIKNKLSSGENNIIQVIDSNNTLHEQPLYHNKNLYLHNMLKCHCSL